MNAIDLHDFIIGGHELADTISALLDERQTILRALRLLAAAEANGGTKAELIRNLQDEADLCRNETATDIADLLDDAASSLIATGALFNALKDERNGLAARVGELEKDAERLVWLMRNMTGRSLRECVGELADTGDIAEFLAAIDAARKP